MKLLPREGRNRANTGTKKGKNKMINPEENSQTGKTRKKKTITFQPEDDVAEMIMAALEAHEEPYGIQSKLINEALRSELPAVLRRWSERQLEAASKLAKRFGNNKKPSKQG